MTSGCWPTNGDGAGDPGDRGVTAQLAADGLTSWKAPTSPATTTAATKPLRSLPENELTATPATAASDRVLVMVQTFSCLIPPRVLAYVAECRPAVPVRDRLPVVGKNAVWPAVVRRESGL